MAFQLYMIRHGKTPANLANKFAGRTAEPLSAEGRTQVESLVPVLADLHLNVIHAGPLLRTRQTAEIIARTTIPLQIAEGLIDIDLPHWDGLTKDEIRQKFSDEYPTWLATPHLFQVDGCEDLHMVQQRAVAQVNEICRQQTTGNILLVTHLIVARCLLLHMTGQPMATFRDIAVANGEVVDLSAWQRGGMDGVA